MPLLDGIIGCWSPSVRGSGYLLPDLSGRGNHGTLTNMDAGTDWPGAAVRGVSGRVLDFDGSDDYVTFPNVAALNVTDWILTVSLWVNVRSVVAFPYFLAKSTGGSSIQYALALNNNQQRFAVGGTFINASFTPTFNQWYHLVGTCDGTNMVTYRDGRSVGTNTRTGTQTTTNPLEMGRLNSLNYTVDAQVGEFAFFRRALTATEVMDIYRSGNGAIGRQLTGQTRRRVYGFVPATGARRRRILCGGNC